MNAPKDHSDFRKQFWCEAWLAVASSDSALAPKTPVTWADDALREFDKRFPEPKNENPPPQESTK